MREAANDDLTLWLDIATDGLPDEVANVVWDEIEAHYEDTVTALRAQGMAPTLAHQNTMAALGEVEHTATKLREVHSAGGRYLIAAAVSLIFPVFAFPVAFFPIWALSELMLVAIILLPSLYMSVTLRRMLLETHDFDLTRWRVWLFNVSVALFTLPLAGAWLLARQPIGLRLEAFFNGEMSLFGYVFILPFVIGMLAFALSLFVMGVRVLQIPGRLAFLKLPFAASMFLSGIGLLLFWVTLARTLFDFAFLMQLVAMLLYLGCHGVWALVFYVGSRRARSANPIASG